MDSVNASLYSTGFTTTSSGANMAAINVGVLLVLLLFFIIVSVLSVVVMWRVYSKANKPGWASIVPIYNVIVLLEIVGRPIWWIILTVIPFANIYVSVVVMLDLARSFRKTIGFGIALIFVPFIAYPILAFSKKAQYAGPLAGGSDVFTPPNPQTPPPVTQQQSEVQGAGQTPEPSTSPSAVPPSVQSSQAPSDPGQPKPPQF